MPIKKGSSKKTISKNIKELMTKKPSKTRSKAINTIAKKKGITKDKAKLIQAKAIAMSSAKKPKKK